MAHGLQATRPIPSDLPMADPLPRCQDVKMSGFVGGHLMAREMSRCQDVKMSRLVGGHLIDRKMSRCQDVQIDGWTSYGP